MNASRYFITGANGLAGSYILRKLIAEGGQVRALKRPSSNLQFVQDIPNVEWVDGDLGNIHLLADYVSDVDFVVHSAGMVSFRKKDRPKLLKINAEGTENLVNVSLDSSIKKFCHISSVSALGNTQTNIITEKNTWDNQNPTSEYALSKHLAEREVWRGIAEGLPAVIVNPSVILGQGDISRSSAKVFGHILEKKKFYPVGNLNVVDAEDVARAVFELLKSDIQSERFILNKEQIEFKTLLEHISKALNYKMSPYQIGKTSLRTAFWLGKLYAVFGGNPPVTSATLRSLLETPTYDASKIEKALNFQFTDIQESVQKVSMEYLNS